MEPENLRPAARSEGAMHLRSPRRTGAGAPGRRASIEDLVEKLAAAADHGLLVLFAEASLTIRTLLGAEQLHILIQSGGAWHRWDQLDTEDSQRQAVVDLPQPSVAWTDVVPLYGSVFAPVKPGSVALVVTEAAGRSPRELGRGRWGLLRSACTVLRLAIDSCEGTQRRPDPLEAIEAFQRIASRILKSQDLQEILLLITHETKSRLSADICGIMLREGDQVVMQRCVGNLSVHTATLRMCEGQGVAGRVLRTGEPCYVGDYLRSDVISRDFFDLARIERVRSALAAPLVTQATVTGVLEVWRRRPSVFTAQHTAELVALASLASIAIESVKLSEARERTVQELAEANQALQTRYRVIQQTAALQEDLTRALLDGKDLTGIAAQAHLHLERSVIFLDEHLNVEAASRDAPCSPDLHRRIKAIIVRQNRTETRLVTEICEPHVIGLQPIIAGQDRFGWIVVLTTGTDVETLPLLVAQIASTVALFHVKRRAAARARSDKLAAVLWDLLDAPEPQRRLAVERARDLNMTFSDDQRVMCCVVHGLVPAEDAADQPAAETDRRARLAGETVLHVADASRVVRLSALRGETIGILCTDAGTEALKRFAESLADRLGHALPTLRVAVGVSTAFCDPLSAAAAYREAQIAAAVARQRGTMGVVFYGEAGVAGLLMGARDDKDFRKFVLATLGPVLDAKAPQRAVLLKTLQSFFAANCSRPATARRLRVHEKTICYRLEKFSRLTGLDLGRHEDRVLTDLALRMHEIVG